MEKNIILLKSSIDKNKIETIAKNITEVDEDKIRKLSVKFIENYAELEELFGHLSQDVYPGSRV